MDLAGGKELNQNGNTIVTEHVSTNDDKIETTKPINGNKKPEQDEGDALGNARCVYQEVVARMVTDRRATHYKMDHKNRGVALVFNHEHFNRNLSLKSRSGTHNDADVLETRLKQLGFEVHMFKDLDYYSLSQHIDTFAKKDYTDSDCLLVAVLSHGELGILFARDTSYKPERLWSPFSGDRCPSLAGKPKLFFIQACQGDKLDGGVTMSRTETDGQCSNSYRIPSQADFLIAYSTVPGYYSWRNTTRGSWFIQALCEELAENGFNYDILTLLTFVTQRVALDYESNVPDSPEMHRQKQIPSITSMLTRLCKFTKEGYESIEDVKTKERNKNIFSGIFSNKSNSYTINRVN